MNMWIRFKIWLALKLKRDYIIVSKRQLDTLRKMDSFIDGDFTISKIYGLRVIIK